MCPAGSVFKARFDFQRIDCCEVVPLKLQVYVSISCVYVPHVKFLSCTNNYYNLLKIFASLMLAFKSSARKYSCFSSSFNRQTASLANGRIIMPPTFSSLIRGRFVEWVLSTVHEGIQSTIVWFFFLFYPYFIQKTMSTIMPDILRSVCGWTTWDKSCAHVGGKGI